MSNPQPHPQSKKVHGTGQRLAIGANVALAVVLAGAIVVMLNWLSYRHAEWFWPGNWFGFVKAAVGKGDYPTDYRFDWTRSAYYRLSDKSKQIVRALKQPVQVIMFYQLTSDSDLRLRNDLQNLLKEYEQLSKNIQAQFVDVDRDPLAVQLIKKHEVTTANTVAVICGDRKKFLNPSDIMEFSGGGNPWMPSPPRATAFKGEQAITGAILSVTEEKQKKVYFLVGHGEKDPDNFNEVMGYSEVAKRLKQDNMLVEKLKLAEKRKIPDDCDVLVISGPTKRLSQEELDLIGKYLDNRGRVYVLLDPQSDSGLEPLLEKWGVRADNNLIMARVSILGLREGITFDAQVGEYGSHPIVDKLKDINCFFPRARSVEAVDSSGGDAPDKPKVTVLAKTPEGYWGETDFRALERREAKFDKDSDKQGPLTIAVAVERGGNVSGVDVGASRLIVVGTSNYLINRYFLEAANSDFFLNGINWLAQREEKIAISPKTPEEFRFTLSASRFKWFTAAVLAGIPGLVTLVGIAVWVRRRK
ncbi:MAG: GldG family protein [Verrucomicrobiae bacterium]|nr:GldG family protein [Verrucomicrobiae bacterium]